VWGVSSRAIKRMAARLAISVVAGAILTILIAWVLAMEEPFHGWPGWRGQYHSAGRAVLPQHRYRTAWGDVYADYAVGPGWNWVGLTGRWTRRNFPEELNQTYRYPEDVPPEQAAVFGNPQSYRLPSWAIRPGPEKDPQAIVTYAWGWPARALCGTEFRHLNYAGDGKYLGHTETLSGFLTTRNGILGDAHGALPVRPYWFGFAVDTLAYGALALAMIAAPGMVRRRVRSWRGRCVACGYDLKGAGSGVCPECGA
jgi:hypothetical protein